MSKKPKRPKMSASYQTWKNYEMKLKEYNKKVALANRLKNS
tara:strand:- start:1172 stop:1294 length:123 start_codon:yes stop_codon:yes gene_type:complete